MKKKLLKISIYAIFSIALCIGIVLDYELTFGIVKWSVILMIEAFIISFIIGFIKVVTLIEHDLLVPIALAVNACNFYVLLKTDNIKLIVAMTIMVIVVTVRLYSE